MMKIKNLLISIVLLFIPALAVAVPISKGKNDDKFTVVIDAGHGGKDVGAVDNNVREKDINLGVALQLAEMIKKKLKEVNVVLTRDNDTFLTLQERASKANKAKGDLFISIHTNSVDKSNKNRTTVAGASVYALGLHKDGNNMEVARRENAVIELEKNHDIKYSGFDPNKDESYIIFEMAQKKNLSQSIKFADEAQKQLVNVAGRKDRGVHQAGFWVLWATSMPAVLVELDFICNPNSAKYLGSEQGQHKLAEALFNAVKSYSLSVLSSKNKKIAYEESNDITEDLLLAGINESGDALASPSRHKEVTAVPSETSSPRHSNSSTPRRRRSASSKVKSESRDVAIAVIPTGRSSRTEQKDISLENEEPVISQSGEKEKNKKSDKRKSDKNGKSNKNKVRSAFASSSTTIKADAAHAAGRRSTKSKSAGTESKMKTVYKIQLLSSVDELSENSTRFCGLGPISSFRENNLYKYTYGESEDKNEIEALLKEVQPLIPEAFVIRVVKLDKKSDKRQQG